jgi:hypothetical protein
VAIIATGGEIAYRDVATADENCWLNKLSEPTAIITTGWVGLEGFMDK